jgi:hypothetical protein
VKADSITIQDFFQAERRHLVPLYQRPYVWQREEQWEPLWEDLRDLAERTLAGRATRPHFLGAIVLDQIRTAVTEVPARLVIDGQQRLTTLQLLMGALREICPAQPDDGLRRRLDCLTRNDDAGAESEQRFKVWPTNVDRPAFAELMDGSAGRSVAQTLEAAWAAAAGEGLLVEAYTYFHEALSGWVREAGEDAAAKRCATRHPHPVRPGGPARRGFRVSLRPRAARHGALGGDPRGAASEEDVVARTYAWAARKQRFTRRQIALARQVLTERGWLDAAGR